MRLQRWFLSAFLALAGCGNVKPTVATDTAAKTYKIFSPAQEAALEAVRLKGIGCRDEFTKCTKPEFICKADLQACSDGVEAQYGLRNTK